MYTYTPSASMSHRNSRDSTASEAEIPLIEGRDHNASNGPPADGFGGQVVFRASAESERDDSMQAMQPGRSDADILSQKELRDVRRFELVGMGACCSSIFGEHNLNLSHSPS